MLTINVPYTVQLQGTCIVFHCSNSEVQHMGFYISLDVSGFMLQHLELMCSEFSAAAEVSVIEVLSSQLLNSMMLMMMPSDSLQHSCGCWIFWVACQEGRCQDPQPCNSTVCFIPQQICDPQCPITFSHHVSYCQPLF